MPCVCKIMPEASIAQPCGTIKMMLCPSSLACLIYSRPMNSLRFCKCFLERMAISPIPSITCATVTNMSSITLLRLSSVQSGKQSFKLISARIRGLPIFFVSARASFSAILSRKRNGIKANNKSTKIPSQIPQFLGCKYDHEKYGS